MVCTPCEDFMLRPTGRSSLTCGHANDEFVPESCSCNLPRCRLYWFFDTASSRSLNDISQLAEPVQAPAVDLAAFREDESVVLADGYGSDGMIETG